MCEKFHQDQGTGHDWTAVTSLLMVPGWFGVLLGWKASDEYTGLGFLNVLTLFTSVRKIVGSKACK